MRWGQEEILYGLTERGNKWKLFWFSKTVERRTEVGRASVSFLKNLMGQKARQGIIRCLASMRGWVSLEHWIWNILKSPSIELDPAADDSPRARWRSTMQHCIATPIREGHEQGKKQLSQEVELLTLEEAGWSSGRCLRVGAGWRV